MKTIEINTQQELDNLPDKFDEYTIIRIKSEQTIVVKKAWGNSTVKALGNSTVEAWDNSTVEAWDNSTVKAWDNSTVKVLGNSTVEAWGNSTVEAWDNSTVKALGNSTVKALGNSTVEAWDNSTVKALGNSTVKALGNSTVKALGNSTVEAWDNSTVEAWGNSTVEALGNSTVELFLSAYVIVLSTNVVVKKLLDFSTAVFKGCKANIKEISSTAVHREVPGKIDVDFEEWIRRGYVLADGLYKKLKSRKKIGEIEVFECEDFPKKTTSFVVKKGNNFSHGSSVEKAIEDLRFKISDRDTSDFDYWKKDLDKKIKIDEAIQGYRVITGACEFGTKEFVNNQGELPELISINEVLSRTKNAYGNDSLQRFLDGNN